MEQPIPKKENILKRPLKVLSRWRPFYLYELISYVLMYAGAIMFAVGIQPYNTNILRIVFFGIATLYCGFFAALIWNDITDKDIDIMVHPTRPLPEGRISKKKFFAVALVFSALTFLLAVLTSPWCLILVGVTALFVAFHNKYLKKKIKLPAYSEIFTPVQWLTVPLFGFFAIWSVLPANGNLTITVPLLGYLSIQRTQLLPLLLLVLFTYFADDAHDLAEGIHDVEGDRRLKVKTYATSFGEKTAARISFLMLFISGILGILLYLMTLLSLFFLIPFIILWLYTVEQSYPLVKTTDDQQRKDLAKLVGKKGYDYLLFSYALIFLDVFLQLIFKYILHWTTVIV
jgi:4-hydroxybenzoate polyprenyltransferase